jgi:hypothetical protein
LLQARAVAAPPQEQLQQAEKPVAKTNGADVEGPIILNGQVGTGCRPLHEVLLRCRGSKGQGEGSDNTNDTQRETLRALYCDVLLCHAPQHP